VPPDLSFPKARRLTRTAEFERVRKEGRVWRGSSIKMVVAPAPSDTESMRGAIITSRKVGGAVRRNRVRRRLREILRCHQHEIRDGIWVLVIASPQTAGVTYRRLEDEWLRLARRASILAA
jgi:ribonuclease P protein component